MPSHADYLDKEFIIDTIDVISSNVHINPAAYKPINASKYNDGTLRFVLEPGRRYSCQVKEPIVEAYGGELRIQLDASITAQGCYIVGEPYPTSFSGHIGFALYVPNQYVSIDYNKVAGRLISR